jgi:septal ring factor EnvC (AmiA/AmiB activator)
MRHRVLVLAGALLVSAVVLADPPPSTPSTASTQKAVAGVNQRVAQHEAEVAHLQQDVGQQESATQQAAERLQQQDRTIEELKRELKAAQDASQKPTAGH